MIPLLLVCFNEDRIDDYIDEYVKKARISSSHVFRFRPITNSITIDQIRQINAFSLAKSQEPRACIIYQFDSARIEAQNAILKTIEERCENILFILTACSESVLLPTIISRVKIIRIPLEKSVTSKLSIDYFYDKKMPLSQKLLQTHKMSRDQALQILEELMQTYGKTAIDVRKLTPEIIEYIMLSHKQIVRNNINCEYALDSVIVKMHGMLGH